jgi:hypothetical protein
VVVVILAGEGRQEVAVARAGRMVSVVGAARITLREGQAEQRGLEERPGMVMAIMRMYFVTGFFEHAKDGKIRVVTAGIIKVSIISMMAVAMQGITIASIPAGLFPILISILGVLVVGMPLLSLGFFSMTVRRFFVTAIRNQIMLQKIVLCIRLHA